jgi:hypothetical protein
VHFKLSLAGVDTSQGGGGKLLKYKNKLFACKLISMFVLVKLIAANDHLQLSCNLPGPYQLFFFYHGTRFL